MSFKELLQNIKHKIIPVKKHTEYDGCIIPAPHLRYRIPEYKDDAFFLQSAETEAKRLVDQFSCSKESVVLDFGCGYGRLAIGLSRMIGDIDYTGIDIVNKPIKWCKKYIHKQHRSYVFKYLNMYHEIYNPNGLLYDKNFHFDYPENTFDIVYISFTLTYLLDFNMRMFLSEFKRLLKNNGKVYLTMFVEENVPDVYINPENYYDHLNIGYKQIVRYEKNYVFSLLENMGYNIDKFAHRTEMNGQSALYLSKK